MAVLADFQIANLCQTGMVQPFDPALVNPASLDIRLGNSLLIETIEHPNMVPYPFGDHSQEHPYLLMPGQFVLAGSLEKFWLPKTICATFALKSSRAREAIDHAKAGFCDPGWHNSALTMEIRNNSQLHPRPLWPGMRIGQMVFEEMSSTPQRCYAQTGRYNGDATVQASRG